MSAFERLEKVFVRESDPVSYQHRICRSAAPEKDRWYPEEDEMDQYLADLLREAGSVRPPAEPSAPVSATHKVRSRWFQAREAWPLREAPVDLLVRERERVATEIPAAPGEARWSSVGPANIGGRATCIACDPGDPARIWLGSAGGGVWRSPDGGKTWIPLWDGQPSLNVGSLAVDPHDPDVLYCGTGEANQSVDSHPGVGLFRSENAGQDWRLVAPAGPGGLPSRIAVVAVDPFDRDHLLVGGLDHLDGATKGLFASDDRGESWHRLLPFIGANRYFCHDAKFHPGQRRLIYATIRTRGTNNGIWRSVDGGANWTQLRTGLPAPDRIHRTSLALAPSDPDVLYAQIENRGAVLGIFRSADQGETWASVGGTHFARERQLAYNNTIVVHPQDPNWVLCGGVDLHRTQDGGRHWQQATRWNVRRGTPAYAHADHHGLLMPAARPGLVYDVNDGGLDVSADGGVTWENRSSGLATNMFYDLEVAQTDERIIAGGAQDNGTLITTDGRPDTYFSWTGGDGGWMVIDPRNDGHIISSSQGLVMYRFRPEDFLVGISPPEDQFRMWMAFVALDSRNPQTLFVGSQRIWRTTNDGDRWTAVSGVLDGSDITALEVARADSRRVYAGTENGGFFRSTDGGVTWSDNLADTVLPGRTITRVASRADNPDLVYATVANYGNSHLFHSADGGLTWADLDRGRLPDVPFNSLAVPAAHPTTVYACSDAGVFVSVDEGGTWANLTRNLPNVMVVDLVYHETGRSLTAATYGRSIWRLPVD